MITFATLFLGLVFGTVDLEMVAARGVTAVELRLDGHHECDLRAPFMTRLDLGAGLAPHELVAIARDRNGKTIGEARQWINRPRALAEASFVLEPADGAPRLARLKWQSVVRENPLSGQVSFDGRPLAATDPSRIVLPRYVPEQLHFLRAELDFGRSVTATADAVFGGERRAEAVTNLTAVPVVLDEARRGLSAEMLDGAFEADGRELRVAATEEGPMEVVFVVAENVRYELDRIAGPAGSQPQMRLPDGLLFRIAWTIPRREFQTKLVTFLFPMTPDVSSEGVLQTARRVAPPADGSDPQLAMAAATAVLSACARDHRRAVVLLLGSDGRDASEVAPEGVRAFAADLRVPLFVWSVSHKPAAVAARFGPVVDASTGMKLASAMRGLWTHLARQRIVWVEGTHLPQKITLTGAARGMALGGTGAGRGNSGGDGRIRTDE